MWWYMASYHDLELLKDKRKRLWVMLKGAFNESDRLKKEYEAQKHIADNLYEQFDELETEIYEMEADLNDSEEDSRTNSE